MGTLKRIGMPMCPVPTFVLDANHRSALATIRSLGRHGVPVISVSQGVGRSLGRASRFSNSEIVLPPPERDVRGAISGLSEHVSRLPGALLFPATDASTLIAFRLSVLSGTSVVAPLESTYLAASDKVMLFETALAVGMTAPRSAVCHSRMELQSEIRRHDLPLVVKPARSKLILDNKICSLSVRVLREQEEAHRFVDTAGWIEHTPALVQEYVAGHGAGVFTLWGPSGPLAWFAHRRLREKPPSGGVSVLCESVPVDPRLKELSTRLLEALEWQGLAMIEFRIDPEGKPWLMEINARLWGSVQLAIDCGVDFPWMAYQLAVGDPVKPVTQYAVGRRLRWLLGDVDNLWLQWKDPKLLPKRKLAATARFLGSFADLHARNEVFRLDDPAPAWAELRQWIRGSK